VFHTDGTLKRELLVDQEAGVAIDVGGAVTVGVGAPLGDAVELLAGDVRRQADVEPQPIAHDGAADLEPHAPSRSARSIGAITPPGVGAFDQNL